MQRMHNELPSAVFPLSTLKVSFPGVMFIRGGLILPEFYSLRAADMWCYATQTSIDPVPRVTLRKPRALLSTSPAGDQVAKLVTERILKTNPKKRIYDLCAFTQVQPHSA